MQTIKMIELNSLLFRMVVEVLRVLFKWFFERARIQKLFTILIFFVLVSMMFMNIKNIPVLPLRDIVVFPHMVAPLFVGRKQSVNALNSVMTGDKKIFLLTQKNSEVDNPNESNLYKFGTIAKVLQLLKLPDGTIKVLVEGLERSIVDKINIDKDFITANISSIDTSYKINTNIKALIKIVIEQFEAYHKVNKKIPIDIVNNLKTYSEGNKISDVVTVNLNITLAQKQELLELISLEERLIKIYGYLVSEIDSFQVEKKIKGRVKRQMEKTQKDYYLNEQMKAIQQELGDTEDLDDIAEIEKKIEEVKLTQEAKVNSKTQKTSSITKT